MVPLGARHNSDWIPQKRQKLDNVAGYATQAANNSNHITFISPRHISPSSACPKSPRHNLSMVSATPEGTLLPAPVSAAGTYSLQVSFNLLHFSPTI
jgi:hypothetical protein